MFLEGGVQILAFTMPVPPPRFYYTTAPTWTELTRMERMRQMRRQNNKLRRALILSSI